MSLKMSHISSDVMEIHINGLDVSQGKDSYIRANMLSWDIEIYHHPPPYPPSSRKKPKTDKPDWYCTTKFPDKKYLRTQDCLPFCASLHSPVLKIMKPLLLLLKEFFSTLIGTQFFLPH